MKNIFSARLAGNLIILLLSLTVVFHLLIITGIIPYQIVWGGRLKDRTQMLNFETISIVVNLFMLLIVCIKMQLIRLQLPTVFIKSILLVMAALFLINTVGNLLSVNQFERLVFTPLTILLCLFCVLLAFSDIRSTKPSPTAENH